MRKQIQTIQEDVIDSLKNVLDRIHKWRGTDYVSYLKTALYGTQEFEYLKRVVGFNLNGKPNLKYGITQEILDLVHDDWMQVTDKEILKSDGLGFMVTDIIYDLLDGKTLDTQNMGSLDYWYNTKFKERVDLEHLLDLYYQLLIKDVEKKIRTVGKLDPKDAIRYIVTFFKGTKYENSRYASSIGRTKNSNDDDELRDMGDTLNKR